MNKLKVCLNTSRALTFRNNFGFILIATHFIGIFLMLRRTSVATRVSCGLLRQIIWMQNSLFLDHYDTLSKINILK